MIESSLLSKHLRINPLRILLLLVIAYYLILPVVVSAMIYYPIKEVSSPYTKVENLYIKSANNVKINAWYIKAKEDKPTVVFCHGNGGNVSYYEYIMDLLSSKGYGVILFDYRGYGNSTGFPSEKGLYNDLNSVINYLVIDQKIPKNKIVLWGLSIGGAVATEIASKDTYKAIILQSTFTNLREEAISRAQAPFPRNVIAQNCMKVAAENLIYYQKYESSSKINKIDCPMLIAHSTNDKLISYKMSQKLAKLNPKAHLYISDLGGHNEHEWFDDEALSFLDNISKNTK